MEGYDHRRQWELDALTRRQLIEGAMASGAIFGLGGVVAACGGGSDEAQDAGGGARPLEGQTLTVLDFGGVTEDAIKEAFADPFSRETGVKVVFDSPTDYAKIKAQVEAGNPTWDVAYTDAFFSMINCNTLFEPLDDVDLTKVDTEYVPSECNAPIGIFGWVFMYGERFTSAPTDGWSGFFDVARHPGKRGIWSFVQNGSLEAALLADGVAPAELYPLDLDRAFKKLDTIKDEIAWFEGLAQGREQMISGTVAASLMTSNRAYDAVNNGAKFTPQWDQHILTYDSFGMVKGAKNPKAAAAFLSYLESPDAQAKFSALTSFGPTTVGTTVEGSELLQDFLATSHAPDGVPMDHGWWGENFDAANEAFTTWQAS